MGGPSPEPCVRLHDLVLPIGLPLLLLAGCSGGNGPKMPDPIDSLSYVAKVSGDNQTAPLGQLYASRFTIQLRQDAYVVSTWNGRLVTFTAPASGAGGEFIYEGLQMVTVSDDRKTAWVISNESGRVSSPPFRANTTAGAFEVRASAFPTYAPSKPGAVLFTATNQAPAAPEAPAPR